MKHIGEITNMDCLATSSDEKIDQNILDSKSAQLVDQIFIKFALLCREFDSLYADTKRLNAEKMQWTMAFSKRKINSREQIQRALDKIEEYVWGKPPQLGQFLEWCSPSAKDLGFPSVEDAYLMSIRMNVQFSEYRHPNPKIDTVIRHAINQIGKSVYREMKAEVSRKIFAQYYEIALKQFMDGKLNAIQKSLPEKPEVHTVDKERNDKARNEAMEAIRKMGYAIKAQ